MKKVAELKRKYSALHKQATDINENAKAANRDVNDEEFASIESLIEENKAVKAELNRLEVLDSLNHDNINEPQKTPQSRSVIAQDYAVITDFKENIKKDPKKGWVRPRDFFLDIINDHFNRPVKNKAGLEIMAAAGSDEQSTFNDAFGGVLIPEGFLPEFLKVDPEEDFLGALTRKIPMDSPTVKIPARTDKDHTTSVTGGLRFFRKAESQTVVESRMEVEQVRLDAHALQGVTFATDELLMDSPMAFASLLASSYQDELSATLTSERLTGTGVGEFEGILNTPSLVTVAKESSQLADTINFQNILKMRARSWGYSKAIWIGNHDIIPQLGQITDGTNNIYLPSLREDMPELLMGRPIVFSEFAETLGDTGDLYLANWSEYLEGILMPLTGSESMHVRFLEGERTFKFWTRNDGRSWWKSPLTPRNSANTLSPFVVLAERDS